MRYKALIIEDNAIVRRLTMRALTAQGFECVPASNAADARELLAGKPFDLVVADLLMPGENGYRLVCELLHQQNRPTVVVLTGVMESRLESHLRRHGIDDVFFKPVDYQVFARRLFELTSLRRPLPESSPSADRPPKATHPQAEADAIKHAPSDCAETPDVAGTHTAEGGSPEPLVREEGSSASRRTSPGDIAPERCGMTQVASVTKGHTSSGVSGARDTIVVESSRATVVSPTIVSGPYNSFRGAARIQSKRLPQPADRIGADGAGANRVKDCALASARSTASELLPSPWIHSQETGFAHLVARLTAALQHTRSRHTRPRISIDLSKGLLAVATLQVAVLVIVCIIYPCLLIVQTNRAMDALQRLGQTVYETESGDIVVRIRPGADAHCFDVLSRLHRLCSLDFQGNNLDDKQLERLATLTKLRELNLTKTQITDRGLESLHALSELEKLALGGTKVSSKGMDSLMRMRSLKHLSIPKSVATKEVIEDLKQKRPELEVVWDEEGDAETPGNDTN